MSGMTGYSKRRPHDSTRWRRAGRGDAGLAEARARLDDDLDTPGVLQVLDREAALGRGVDKAAELLGVAL